MHCFVPSLRHPFQRLLPLPAAGCRNESAGTLNAVGARCYSWSSSPFSATSPNGGRLWCTASDVNPLNNNNRSLGQSVRCVQASADRSVRGIRRGAVFFRDSCIRATIAECRVAGCILFRPVSRRMHPPANPVRVSGRIKEAVRTPEKGQKEPVAEKTSGRRCKNRCPKLLRTKINRNFVR